MAKLKTYKIFLIDVGGMLYIACTFSSIISRLESMNRATRDYVRDPQNNYYKPYMSLFFPYHVYKMKSVITVRLIENYEAYTINDVNIRINKVWRKKINDLEALPNESEISPEETQTVYTMSDLEKERGKKEDKLMVEFI